MRCAICDAVLDSPNYSSDHESYDPCEKCLMVVQDTLKGYEDQPSADEDAFGGPGDSSDIIAYNLYADPDYDGLEEDE